MTEQSAYTFSSCTGWMSAVTRTNNDSRGLCRNAEPFAMPCGERKRPSQPSEPAELKTNRRKETALRNACIANLRACLLFSSTNRVSADFGARHNHNINLCGTESECAIRLYFIYTAVFASSDTDQIHLIGYPYINRQPAIVIGVYQVQQEATSVIIQYRLYPIRRHRSHRL